MWRASLVAIALVAPAARADDVEPELPPVDHERTGDPRSQLAQQVADEAAAIDRALALVGEKLAGADAARARRLAAAYRVLSSPTGAADPIGARDPDRAGHAITVARRRAAARWLVDHDLAERRLLADEATRLRSAAERTRIEVARVPEIELPTELGRPANGVVVRPFGTTEHERTKATLARRGIDLEVDARAPVAAPADGTVRYSGPIRGLDTGVIIDHGSYLTVIAKLGDVAVPVGATLARGDRLGRAARHRVYLEVRIKLGPGGLPIDPEPLLAKPR